MKRECGQAFILVLILLGIGAALIVPFLQMTNTVTMSRQMYGQFIKEDYTADAAVEYGMWRLKHEPGFAESLPIGTESEPFYVTLNGVTASTTIMSQALEIPLSGQDLAGRAEDEIFFKVNKTVIATTTYLTLAADGFESGDGSGGTGSWTGDWTLSGYYFFNYGGAPEGSRYLWLYGDTDESPGDGYAQREVDLSGSTGLGPYLQFRARVDSFESYHGDEAYVKVSTNPPTYTSIAFDGFESGDGSGGTGDWIDNWTFSGESSVTDWGYPYQGSRHLRLRGDQYPPPGDGYAQRCVDLSSYPNAELRFFAKLSQFESGDEVDVKVSTNGADWDVLHTFTDADDDSLYHCYVFDLSSYGAPSSTFYVAFDATNLSRDDDYFYVDNVELVDTGGGYWDILQTFTSADNDWEYYQYQYDLSSYGTPASFYVAFEAHLNSNHDYFYIDDIKFTNSQEATVVEPGVLTEFTYYVSLQCVDPDG